MSGRWRVLGRDAPVFGTPWLLLKGDEHAGVLWNGPVLELDRGVARRLGPDILAEPPDYATMVARIRSESARQIGDALLDQRLVAGIGNVWKVESLWTERISPWRRVADVTERELQGVLESAHRLMRASVDGVPVTRHVYRRKGHMCPRCGTPVESWPQGDDARMAYWCPECQKGEGPATA
jgi:endonuclease-8